MPDWYCHAKWYCQYYSCWENCNYQQAAEIYRDCFPDRQHSNDRTIARLVLCQQQRPIQKRQRRINIPERHDPPVAAILAMTAINVSMPNSERIRYPEVYSPQNMWPINFHPYHITLMQDLTPDDFRRRLMFCNWAQTMLQHDRTFFRYCLKTKQLFITLTNWIDIIAIIDP